MKHVPSIPHSQSAASQHLVFVDTDIGDDIDDALALAVIMNSPEIALLGVSTVFGDTVQRARLATHLLHAYGCPAVPVAAGSSRPLQFRHRPSGVPQASVLDGRAGELSLSPFSGPDLLIHTALEHAGQLTLLCFGPLTNVATALHREPALASSLRQIILMGGTSGMPWPDWNVRSDPQAAQIVLSAKVPVTMIGWNVTSRCQLRTNDLERLHVRGSPGTELLSQLILVWQQHRSGWHPKRPYLHDPLTVVALCSPTYFRFEKMTARVLTSGPLTGFTIPRITAGPLVRAATYVQAERAREWIMQRLLVS